jgi:hypothetical protein
MLAIPGMKNLCRHRISKRSSPIPRIDTDCRERMAERYEANWFLSAQSPKIVRSKVARKLLRSRYNVPEM